MRGLLLLLALAHVSGAATRLYVTVTEPKSGKAITGLTAADFTVTEEKAVRRVESAEYLSGPVDAMLLVDTSLVGPVVEPVARSLVSQLGEKEQMAIVAFHSSADLIQDFTASKELLHRALGQVKYGNSPRVVDAVYAAIDGGFDHSTLRRVILLVTAGLEGPSRTPEREALKLARRNGVSIYPIYASGGARGLFESLARQSGGAVFNLRDLSKAASGSPAGKIFDVVRGRYTLTVSGNLSLGEKVKVDVREPAKAFVSVQAE